MGAAAMTAGSSFLSLDETSHVAHPAHGMHRTKSQVQPQWFRHASDVTYAASARMETGGLSGTGFET